MGFGKITELPQILPPKYKFRFATQGFMNSLDWTATLNSIKEDLPTAQFQNWLKPIEYISSDDTSVCLGVPSRFHEDMLRSRFVDTLKKAIRRQTGNDLQLEFEVLVRDENTEASKSEILAPQ
ncbi:hypothetical protein EBQ74_09720, partial [bacterium]|nr:hypothetical protein [bacterium]